MVVRKIIRVRVLKRRLRRRIVRDLKGALKRVRRVSGAPEEGEGEAKETEGG
jgi:hypothetical protein